MDDLLAHIQALLVGVDFSILSRVKMGEYQKTYPDDYLGIRIIAESMADTDEALRRIKVSFSCKRIKDCITDPWEDGYQSIHISTEWDGVPLEIQLRTKSMDEQAKRLILQKGDHYWRKKS